MFEFKAYIWDNQVYIDDIAYKSNEILTACLNLPDDDLADCLNELYRLRARVQLEEGGNYDFCMNYDKSVQQAQKMFFRIGNKIKKIPPYCGSSSLRAALDSSLLWDCLNEHFSCWEDGIDPADYEFNRKNEDFCNKYGFVFKNDLGIYSFYYQRFFPMCSTLENEEPKNILMIREANKAICELFDAFIVMVQDLLRVQRAYSDLLDNYINAKSKFLTETELAACFTDYLKVTKYKTTTDHVVSSNSMQMSHEVYRRADGKAKLCEVYTFNSLGAFLYFDFFSGLKRSCLPKRCDNCGLYFLLEGGKYSSYCERPLESDPDKTCRDVGARKKYGDKCKTDPVWLAYNRAYKAHYARCMKKKMTTAVFEQWSRQAVEWRRQAEEGKLEQAEYERLLKK